MKTEPAFVRTDRAVHLDAEPAVHLQLALIVLPRHTEYDDAFRLDDPLEDFSFAILGMLIEHRRERFDDFLHGLVKFWFGRVLRFHIGH